MKPQCPGTWDHCVCQAYCCVLDTCAKPREVAEGGLLSTFTLWAEHARGSQPTLEALIWCGGLRPLLLLRLENDHPSPRRHPCCSPGSWVKGWRSHAPVCGVSAPGRRPHPSPCHSCSGIDQKAQVRAIRPKVSLPRSSLGCMGPGCGGRTRLPWKEALCTSLSFNAN